MNAQSAKSARSAKPARSATEARQSALYGENTLARFWRLPFAIGAPAWEPAVGRLLASLPRDGKPAPDDWDELMEYILGEGQFGPRRYRLSAAKRLYYALRPALPRRLTAVLRRTYHHTQDLAEFPLAWPREDRYARFLYAALDGALRGRAGRPALGAGTPGDGIGVPVPAYRRLIWPDQADFAFVLTHDVERAAGRDFVRRLAAVDERYGFRSSFNFVPEAYATDAALMEELQARGFEVGVHGLIHDGRLFSSRARFERRARRINGYLARWGAIGFRSPLTHRNPEWMQALDIEYDLSCFDTDPYEPMPGGTMAIWPFFCGRFVELPYTLPQDHTLFVILGERTPRLWIEKLDFIARWGGMALLNVHPDYLLDSARLGAYEAFLQHMASLRSAARVWHALPRDVARWWRSRSALSLTEVNVLSTAHQPPATPAPTLLR